MKGDTHQSPQRVISNTTCCGPKYSDGVHEDEGHEAVGVPRSEVEKLEEEVREVMDVGMAERVKNQMLFEDGGRERSRGCQR